MSSVFCKHAKRCFLGNCSGRHLVLPIFILFIGLALSQVAFAAQITLAWDPNIESGLAGYKIHFGTSSHNYSRTVDAGKVTTYTLTDLVKGQTYFIAVTAYDTSNNESGYSNEVSGVGKEPIHADGDFNGDGKIDLLWRQKTACDNIVWFMDGVTYLDYDYLPQVCDTNWEIVRTGDFNGDGYTDLLWQHKTNGGIVAWFLQGVTVSNSQWIVTSSDLNWEIVGTGDFNGDGKADVLRRQKTNGGVYVWYMDGVNLVGGAWITTTSDTNWEIVGTGDFNGDGKVDILWRHKTIGEVYVWYMDGVNLVGAAWITTNFDTNWEIVGPRE